MKIALRLEKNAEVSAEEQRGGERSSRSVPNGSPIPSQWIIDPFPMDH